MKLKMKPNYETTNQFYQDLRTALFEDVQHSGIDFEIIKPFLKFIKTEATDHEILHFIVRNSLPEKYSLEEHQKLLDLFKDHLVEQYSTSDYKTQIVKLVTEVAIPEKFSKSLQEKAWTRSGKSLLTTPMRKIPGKIIKPLILPAAAIAAAVFAVKKYKDKKLGECKYVTPGPERQACMKNKYLEIRKFQMQKINNLAYKCNRSEDPEKCKANLQTKLGRAAVS